MEDAHVVSAILGVVSAALILLPILPAWISLKKYMRRNHIKRASYLWWGEFAAYVDYERVRKVLISKRIPKPAEFKNFERAVFLQGIGACIGFANVAFLIITEVMSR